MKELNHCIKHLIKSELVLSVPIALQNFQKWQEMDKGRLNLDEVILISENVVMFNILFIMTGI